MQKINLLYINKIIAIIHKIVIKLKKNLKKGEWTNVSRNNFFFFIILKKKFFVMIHRSHVHKFCKQNI